MNHSQIDGKIDQKMKGREKRGGAKRGELEEEIKTTEASSEDMSLKENSIVLSLSYCKSCAFLSFLMECY